MYMDQSTGFERTGNIKSLVIGCLNAELAASKEKNTLSELTRYLNDFSAYCEKHNVDSPDGITADSLYGFIEFRCKNKGPSLKKAVVWALRKFCNYLNLINVLKKNLASKLRHPKFTTRSELPTYLSESQTRKLIEYAALNLELNAFSILSLMLSTGLRPNEIVRIKKKDVHLDKRYFEVKVKGGWIKQSALSEPTVTILTKYLATRDDDCDALFVNKRRRPVSKSWLRQMLKSSAEKLGFSFSLTPNIIRHTFATHAADKHGKVITKALMGHRRLSTTEVYTHLSPRHFRSLMNHHPYQNR